VQLIISSRMKFSLFGLFLLAIVQNSFSQKRMFLEEDKLLLNQFENSELLKQKAVSDRYDELTRSEGFIVNDVSVSGSVYTKMLHRSGKVIFNCPASAYLNKIKSKLLSDYPKLDKLIQVYVTEDPSLNAFATVNNLVYVNIGLLARIENEAQLAFILSHEIMHIVNTHIISSTLNLNREAKVYTKSNVGIDNEYVVLRQHEMSREFEIEADLDGVALYLKQNYDPNEAVKALMLLKQADDYTFDIQSNSKMLFLAPSEYDNLKKDYNSFFLAASDSIAKKKEKRKSIETHPSVDERIEKMTKLIDNDQFKNNGKSIFLISEEDFTAIKNESIELMHKMYTEDKDFLSLFLYSSSALQKKGDNSKSNLNYLGYALQGLLFDHHKKHKIGSARSTNSADSLMSYFYKKSTADEFAKWAYHAIDTLSEHHSDNQLTRYKEVIIKTILDKKPKSLTFIFGSDSTLALNYKNDTVRTNGIDMNKIDFQVSAFSDMSSRKVAKYNHFEKFESIKPGNLGIIGLNLIHIRKKEFLTQDYVIDLPKVEAMERSADKVCENLEVDFNGQVISYIPNSLSYKGKEYYTYDKLNQWLSERLFFDNSNYVSIYEEDIKEIQKADGLKYVMSTVNVGVKSFSFKSFAASYFSPFVMPIYFPQIVAHIIGSSTRKYQLAMAFDLETGNLIFWDRRTYLDPNTQGQLQVLNNDVLNNFFHAKK
jgi:hypothetical protein